MSVQSRRGPEWEATRLRILNRDGWLCAYCGVHLEGRNATVDHVIPIDLGGTDDEHNLVAACRPCNGKKSNRTMLRSTWFNPAWLEALP